MIVDDFCKFWVGHKVSDEGWFDTVDNSWNTCPEDLTQLDCSTRRLEDLTLGLYVSEEN